MRGQNSAKTYNIYNNEARTLCNGPSLIKYKEESREKERKKEKTQNRKINQDKWYEIDCSPWYLIDSFSGPFAILLIHCRIETIVLKKLLKRELNIVTDLYARYIDEIIIGPVDRNDAMALWMTYHYRYIKSVQRK